jgi:host factor-I protein
MQERSPEVVSDRRLKGPESVNRKLIRASLSDMKEQVNPGNGIRKRLPPPEQTHAENFYYLKQMAARTPMVVVLDSGEVLHGVIEWYDQQCIKVNRVGKPNLLIMKSAIRYMHKQQSGVPGNTARVGR